MPWTKLSFEDEYLAFENVTEYKNDFIEDIFRFRLERENR